MKTGPAVVDTSAILMMVLDVDPKDAARINRRARTEESFGELRKAGVSFAVPAPVITELGMVGEVDGEAIAHELFARFGGFRDVSLDLPAAETAAKMLRKTFQEKRATKPRDAVKVDAMIAAIAVELGASCIVTANPSDFIDHLAAIGSTLEVLHCDAVRKSGQLRFLDIVTKK